MNFHRKTKMFPFQTYFLRASIPLHHHPHPPPHPSLRLNHHFQPDPTRPDPTRIHLPSTSPPPKIQTLMKNLALLERALIGAAGGGIAGAFTYVSLHPLDTIKTKMQTKRLMMQVHGEAENRVAAVVYGGVSETVKQILKEEGWVGLTKGMGPRVLHSACFSALGYFAFCFGPGFGETIITERLQGS